MYFLNEKLLRRCLTLFEQYYEDPTISLHLLDIMTFILRNRFYLYYDQGSKKDLGRRLLTPALWTQICKIGDFLWNSKNPGHLKSFFDWLCVLMESFLRRGGKNRKQKYYFFVWLNGPAWQSLPRGFLPYFSKSLFSTNFDFPALNSFLQLFLLFDRLCTVFSPIHYADITDIAQLQQWVELLCGLVSLPQREFHSMLLMLRLMERIVTNCGNRGNR